VKDEIEPHHRKGRHRPDAATVREREAKAEARFAK
jgi:hypothetical protein